MKKIGKAQLVKELLSFDFRISHHFVTIFRNISTFQDAISPNATELFQKFSPLFLSRHTLKIIYLFCHNLNFKFCCQSCDVIFPLKTVKIEKQKHTIFWNTKFYHPAKFELKRIKKCKSSSKDALLGVLYAHRVNTLFFSREVFFPVFVHGITAVFTGLTTVWF